MKIRNDLKLIHFFHGILSVILLLSTQCQAVATQERADQLKKEEQERADQENWTKKYTTESGAKVTESQTFENGITVWNKTSEADNGFSQQWTEKKGNGISDWQRTVTRADGYTTKHTRYRDSNNNTITKTQTEHGTDGSLLFRSDSSTDNNSNQSINIITTRNDESPDATDKSVKVIIKKNNKVVAEKDYDTYKKSPTLPTAKEAMNNKDTYDTVVKTLSPPDDPTPKDDDDPALTDDEEGLSGGAIAGIISGGVALVSTIGTAIYNRKSIKQAYNNWRKNPTESTDIEVTANTTATEESTSSDESKTKHEGKDPSHKYLLNTLKQPEETKRNISMQDIKLKMESQRLNQLVRNTPTTKEKKLEAPQTLPPLKKTYRRRRGSVTTARDDTSSKNNPAKETRRASASSTTRKPPRK